MSRENKSRGGPPRRRGRSPGPPRIVVCIRQVGQRAVSPATSRLAGQPRPWVTSSSVLCQSSSSGRTRLRQPPWQSAAPGSHPGWPHYTRRVPLCPPHPPSDSDSPWAGRAHELSGPTRAAHLRWPPAVGTELFHCRGRRRLPRAGRSGDCHLPGPPAVRGRVDAAGWPCPTRRNARSGRRAEVREETALKTRVVCALGPVTIIREGTRYLIHEHLVVPVDDTPPQAGDDAADVAWVSRDALSELGVRPDAIAVVDQALAEADRQSTGTPAPAGSGCP